MPENCKNPKDYNNCSKGHKMQFRQPKGYADPHDEWGFHLKSCTDYVYQLIEPVGPPEYGKIRLLQDHETNTKTY